MSPQIVTIPDGRIVRVVNTGLKSHCDITSDITGKLFQVGGYNNPVYHTYISSLYPDEIGYDYDVVVGLASLPRVDGFQGVLCLPSKKNMIWHFTHDNQQYPVRDNVFEVIEILNAVEVYAALQEITWNTRGIISLGSVLETVTLPQAEMYFGDAWHTIGMGPTGGVLLRATSAGSAWFNIAGRKFATEVFRPYFSSP
jgi:hypothetical protein